MPPDRGNVQPRLPSQREGTASGLFRSLSLSLSLLLPFCPSHLASSPPGFPGVEPLLTRYCFDCHGDGEAKGNFAFDRPAPLSARLEDHGFWLSVWENTRAQLMPPPDKPQPSPAERKALTAWIERAVFRLDPAKPDPGHVPPRRLNREEYQHTILDLFDHHFLASHEFPPDDSGLGFTNHAEALTLSPLLFEKYLAAARQIAAAVVPTGPQPPTLHFGAALFQEETGPPTAPLPLSHAREFRLRVSQPHPGPYRLTLEYALPGAEVETDQTAELTLQLKEREVLRDFLAWGDSEPVRRESEVSLSPGENEIVLSLLPRSPARESQGDLQFSLRQVRLHGPLDGSHRVLPRDYRRVFLEGPPPPDPAARAAYASRLLAHWGRRILRRPLEEAQLSPLLALLRQAEDQGKTFEEGFSEAIAALLASPRFLFRTAPLSGSPPPGSAQPIDEFSLASRLSYFLWNSTPDDELLDLASRGELRRQFALQVDRLITSPKLERFIASFTGQWLQTRDVAGPPLQEAMRRETELLFLHLLREDRPVLELLQGNSAFLNEDLALFYGIPGVLGQEPRLIALPPGSHRGGLLGQASILTVTSHPHRTSPVKRGLFVLENLLGLPSPPPPPEIPPLEETLHRSAKPLTSREALAQHRENPECASCHDRIDPLGLALENFDAFGHWRDLDETGHPIDASGRLPTGETFTGPDGLAQLLATSRRRDFLRCLTEKLLTYALGRGVEYFDAPTIDAIVDRLETEDAGLRTLLHLIVASPAFQQSRPPAS